MGSLRHGILCGHGHHVHFALQAGQKKNDALSQFILQLVAQIPESVHVHALHCCRQELHTLHFLHIVEHISQGFSGRLSFQGLKL